MEPACRSLEEELEDLPGRPRGRCRCDRSHPGDPRSCVRSAHCGPLHARRDPEPRQSALRAAKCGASAGHRQLRPRTVGAPGVGCPSFAHRRCGRHGHVDDHRNDHGHCRRPLHRLGRRAHHARHRLLPGSAVAAAGDCSVLGSRARSLHNRHCHRCDLVGGYRPHCSRADAVGGITPLH